MTNDKHTHRSEFHKQTQNRLAVHDAQFSIEVSVLKQEFPVEFKAVFKGTPILVIGDGDWYHGWKSVEYRLNFMTDDRGRNRYVYDPKYLKDDKVDLKLVEILAGNQRDPKTMGTIILLTSEIPADTNALILSPNRHHLSQLKECIFNKNVSGIYVEKPMVIDESELSKLEELILKQEKPLYFGDHYIFAGIGLFALLGKQMPYKNLLTISSDPEGQIAKSFEQCKPILKNIVRIEGRVVFEGHENLTSSRSWLRKANIGGGVLLDLGIHVFNVIHNLGFKVKNIMEAILKVSSSDTEIQKGEYDEIPKDSNRAEDFAMIKGEMLSGTSYVFEFAQFEVQSESYLQLTDQNNHKLKMQFESQRIQYLDQDNTVIGELLLYTDAVLLLMHHTLRYF